MADTTVADINAKAKEVGRKIQEFFDQLNDTLSWVPSALEWVIKAVEDGLKVFEERLQEFWKELNKFFAWMGSVPALRMKADMWERSVSQPLGETAGDIALHRLRAPIEWQGRAAEAYKAVVPSQADGLTALKTLARQVQSSLDSLANALTAFYVAIAAALAAFIVGLTGAIAACCTGVGAPLGVAEIAGVVSVVIGLITAASAAVVAFANSLATDQNSLTQKILDVGNTWPKSVLGDLSDGSVSDGDGSDWRVNQ
ncbi:hypothetical protein E1161_25915 [Saccharopolyspora aridisoli]|uniref:Uncharacterized protein n=1 Tax=Saccharopolyspora aridisoli TaxID=2530385 RepID=A0A4R4UGG5_9PSEU|nr:hypothetical protein [Saccharopolyspora aridisoli]TDC87333.1 hypothetical protein E1161_25915 [Saccharopolyspora aridisoli]